MGHARLISRPEQLAKQDYDRELYATREQADLMANKMRRIGWYDKPGMRLFHGIPRITKFGITEVL